MNNNNVTPISHARTTATGELATVASARAGEALTVARHDGLTLPVAGHLSHVDYLAEGDIVTLAPDPRAAEAAIVTGRLRRAGEDIPFRYQDGRLHLTAGKKLVLQAGHSTVELSADGHIAIDGKSVGVTGDNRLALGSRTIALN
ncbi:hypothetical protein CAI21_09580 [Alkalilimnicola ehrlichii]|uniref:Uncharacterized protein n=1 Tax=Alkalilimnicola ehrlichii TaxID=351052 RepID=A0A3E0WVH8_9GAMM|nr:hypothetical protein [Alkalilimnicola ehrlichii]RFA29315.1 hypothetical protein CAI21_09580 [Alkalilimnicola ehrlichii]RFA36828.1 hypothetical protein CAL65_09910 [Alkalilimnicola ehrlichii]